MQKKELVTVLLIFLVILISKNTTAEILLGQTEPFYNVGDEFNISVTLRPNQDISDFLVVWLNCEGNEVEIYRAPYSLEALSEKVLLISAVFGNFLGSSLEGSCHIRAMFGNEAGTSQNFDISRKIDVTLNVQGAVFSPDDNMLIYGQALKNHKNLKEGFVELKLDKINFSYTDVVRDGKFNFSIKIPSNAPSDNYKIDARVYEKDRAGTIINEGTATEKIKIRQLVKSNEIALGSQEINPGEELTYQIIVYDQAKEHVKTNVSVTIYAPKDNIFEKRIVNSDTTNKFNTGTNHTPGYWKLEAEVAELKSNKVFFVNELELALFKLENQTLTISNVGNVPYKKQVEISVGDSKEIKKLELGIGESKKFKLKAPDGNYRILANDGSSLNDLGTTFLTGRAISVEEFGNLLNGNVTIIISLILILIVGIVILILYRRILKERALRKGKVPQPIITSSPLKPLKKSSQPVSKNLIDKGEKQECAILALYLENFENVSDGKETQELLDNALWKAKEEGAKVYVDGLYRTMVFAPILTKQPDNSIKALRVAQAIERMLKEYNKKFNKKIDFGIGVNFGELIVESKDGKFRFASLGNVITLAKKLARNSKSEILCSETIRTRAAGKAKITKTAQGAWKLEKLIDRSVHEDFINKFKLKNKF